MVRRRYTLSPGWRVAVRTTRPAATIVGLVVLQDEAGVTLDDERSGRRRRITHNHVVAMLKLPPQLAVLE